MKVNTAPSAKLPVVLVMVIARVLVLYDTVPWVPGVKTTPSTFTTIAFWRVETASSSVKLAVPAPVVSVKLSEALAAPTQSTL